MKNLLMTFLILSAVFTACAAETAEKSPSAADTSVSSAAEKTDSNGDNTKKSSETSAKKSTGGNIDDEDYPDKLYSDDHSNVRLTILRCGNNYFAYDADEPDLGWVPAEGVLTVKDVGDGCFVTVNADISRLWGGVAGFAGDIKIRKLRSADIVQTNLETAVSECKIAEYTPGEEIRSRIMICRNDGKTYCMVTYQGYIHIFLDGEPVGSYDTNMQAEAAMGLRSLPDESVRMENMPSAVGMYVIRCGDTYLSYSHSMEYNRYWTKIYDENFENKLPENAPQLEDGGMCYIRRADVIKLNGGEAGYENAPMITSVTESGICDYLDIYTGMKKFEGEELSDNDNARFFWSSGLSLIFYADGVYNIYRYSPTADTHSEFVGRYSDIAEVKEALGYEEQ